MDTLLQDLRYALRTLRRSPGFTLIAVLTLALGIGANTAIFSMVNAVLLRPLGYEDPERLLLVYQMRQQQDAGRIRATPLDLLDWREQTRTFEALAGHVGTGFTLTGDGEPELVIGQLATAELFSVLGVQPMLGRAIRPEENEAGRDQVMVLSYGLWQRRFGGDPGIVGRQITANGKSFTVVGVMPRGFDYPGKQFQLWVPLALRGASVDGPPITRGSHYLQVIGRLRPGVSANEAQAELTAISERLAQEYPETNEGVGATIVPLREEVVGKVRPALLVLLGAVGFVLLIACANVTSLLLARASGRQREVAIRAAVGASRPRLIRQLLTENAVIFAFGGAAGLLLASWGLGVLVALSPGDIPRLEETAIDAPVLLFALGVSLLTTLSFGLAPALQLSRNAFAQRLRTGDRSGTTGRRSQRTRSALIVGEIALSLVLLIGAGLAIRSFARLQQVDTGFQADNALSFLLVMRATEYSEPSQMWAFYQQMLERLQSQSPVDAVGATTHLPLSGQDLENSFSVEGYVAPESEGDPVAGVRGVGGEYFRAMGIPLRRGRPFSAQDREGAPPVAIVNESFARRYWPGEDPIGKRLRMGGPDDEAPWHSVVGVSADVRHRGPAVEVRPEVYLPYAQLDEGFLTNWARAVSVVVRGRAEPAALVSVVREQIRALDPGMPLHDVQTMEQRLSESVAQPRFRTLLLGLFGFVALALATVGIFGVMSYLVTQRTREIGIRMALGAQGSNVLAMVVGRGAKLALIGIALGAVGAYASTRWMQALLYEVSPTDPVTFAAVSLLLGATALLASYLPARRATRVDPMIALRAE